MQEIIDFLNQNRDGYLATMEGDQPRVRVFQFNFAEKGKLYFITANNKPVFYQLQKNPRAEFCVMAKDSITYVRITGTVGFSNDRAIIEKMLNNSPLAKAVYKTADNPITRVMYLEKCEAILSVSPAEPTKKFSF